MTNVFNIGDIDLSGVATVENYHRRGWIIDLVFNLTGSNAISKEYDLETAAEYAGRVNLVEPHRSTPFYQDLSPSSKNSTSLRVGPDYQYSGREINSEVVWLDYSAEHDTGMPNSVRIQCRFGINEVFEVEGRTFSVLDSCESGWGYWELDDNDAISGNQNVTDWTTEGSGSTKITGGVVTGTDLGGFYKFFDLSSYKKIKLDIYCGGGASTSQVKVAIALDGDIRWEKRNDQENVHYPEIDVSDKGSNTHLSIYLVNYDGDPQTLGSVWFDNLKAR